MADEPEVPPGTGDPDPATPPTPEPVAPEPDQAVKAALVKAHKEAETLRLKLKEIEDRDKSETQKASEAAADAERRAAEAVADVTRLRMAIKYGLDEDDLDLLGTGTDEQIEGRAKRLAEKSGTPAPQTRRPTATLRGGGNTQEDPDDESDPRALAARIPRR